MRNRILHTAYIDVLLIAMLMSLLSCSTVPEASVTLTTNAATTAPTDEQGRTIITIAGCSIIGDYKFESSYLMTACRIYEEEHPNVTFKVIDYNLEYGYEQGPTQLRLDLLSGKGADIYIYTPYDFDVKEEVAFLDLSNFIASDSEFSTADYYWNIVEDTRIDGGLYAIPLDYEASFMYGPESLLAGIDSWTITDVMALEDTLPEGLTLINGSLGSSNLAYYMSHAFEKFIDPATGAVDLENEAFYEVLEYANRFTRDDEVTGERLHDKRLALSTTTIGNISDYSTEFCWEAEPQVIIGFPEFDGAVKAEIDYSLSISATSGSPDIAWEVLKHFLSEDMQIMTSCHNASYVYGVPLNRKAAELEIDQVEAFYSSQFAEQNEPYREEYLAFLDSITSVEYDNVTVFKAVKREAPSYFVGMRNAEELARVLEDRINEILAEDGNLMIRGTPMDPIVLG